VADEVLAKHDEKYMPPEVARVVETEGQPLGSDRCKAHHVSLGAGAFYGTRNSGYSPSSWLYCLSYSQAFFELGRRMGDGKPVWMSGGAAGGRRGQFVFVDGRLYTAWCIASSTMISRC